MSGARDFLKVFGHLADTISIMFSVESLNLLPDPSYQILSTGAIATNSVGTVFNLIKGSEKEIGGGIYGIVATLSLGAGLYNFFSGNMKDATFESILAIGFYVKTLGELAQSSYKKYIAKEQSSTE
jgi:hypothetical protein